MKKQDNEQLPNQYQIRIQGHLDAYWSSWFDDLDVSHETDGTTLLIGPIADQSALHGLLVKIRDLGLPLMSINPVERAKRD